MHEIFVVLELKKKLWSVEPTRAEHRTTYIPPITIIIVVIHGLLHISTFSRFHCYRGSSDMSPIQVDRQEDIRNGIAHKLKDEALTSEYLLQEKIYQQILKICSDAICRRTILNIWMQINMKFISLKNHQALTFDFLSLSFWSPKNYPKRK